MNEEYLVIAIPVGDLKYSDVRPHVDALHRKHAIAFVKNVEVENSLYPHQYSNLLDNDAIERLGQALIKLTGREIR